MTGTMERRETTMEMIAGTMESSDAMQAAGAYLLRYGLVLVIAWIGFMKFTAYEAAARRSSIGRFALISPGVVALPENSLGFTRGLLVQDPDGHVMQVIDK